jgi:hypothetical protein
MLDLRQSLLNSTLCPLKYLKNIVEQDHRTVLDDRVKTTDLQKPLVKLQSAQVVKTQSASTFPN